MLKHTFEHSTDDGRKNKTQTYTVHEYIGPIRNQLIGNTLVERQVFLNSDPDFNIENTVLGEDFSYANIAVLYVPSRQSDIIDKLIENATSNWVSGNSNIYYSISGYLNFLTRTTENGSWLFIIDMTSYGSGVEYFDSIIHTLIENGIEIQEFTNEKGECDYDSAQFVLSLEECSGQDFYSYFSREDNPIWKLMQFEKLYDNECTYYSESDSYAP